MMRVASLEYAVIKGAAVRAAETVVVDTSGVRQDRRFVLFDRDAKQLYAHRSPSLCGVQADADDETLTVRLPGGETACAKIVHGERVAAVGWDDIARHGAIVEGPFAPLLSKHLRRPVWLLDLAAWERRGVDVEPVTLLSLASIDRLASRIGLPTLDHRRFRATIVLAGADEPHEEDGWIGKEVDIGDARLYVSGPIPRCAVITRDPDTGRRDADTLRAIRRYRGMFTDVDGSRGIPFGVYARVMWAGRLSVGDPVRAVWRTTSNHAASPSASSTRP